MSERIPENVRRADYTAAAGQTDFIISFPYQDPADVAVARYIGAGGDEDGFLFLSQPDDFEVVGQQVVLVTPAAAGDVIRVEGSAALKRVTGIAQSGKFASKLLDGELDRRVMVEQELGRDLQDLRGRAFVARFDEEGGTLPGKSARAGRTLAFDQAGEPKPGPTADEVAQAQSHAQAAAGSAGAAQASATQANTAKAEAISARDAAWAQVKAAKPKNWIINGGFQVWQRGVSFPNIPHNTAFADRWRSQVPGGSGGTIILRRYLAASSSAPEVNQRPCIKLRATTGGNQVGILQKVINAKQFENRVMTFGCWVYVPAGRTFRITIGAHPTLAQWSPYNVVSETTFTGGGGWAYRAGSFFTNYSSYPISSDEGFISFQIRQVDHFTGAYDAYFTNVGLYEGDWTNHPDPFTYETHEEALLKCMPYFRKPYIGIPSAQVDQAFSISPPMIRSPDVSFSDPEWSLVSRSKDYVILQKNNGAFGGDITLDAEI